ncbi:hypothetical protein BG000_002906 [Podila horticola]|nr:hypothetical protein BG000_002906 [Podila horticola]
MAGTHPHLATVINELVQIWNCYKRHAQQAFTLFLAEQNEESPEFITLMATFDLPRSSLSSKEGHQAMRSNLAALLARLLLRLATGIETYSKSDKWTTVLSSIYHNYTRIANNISLDNPKKYALSCLFVPLATKMSKEIVCAWSRQVEGMTEKLDKILDTKLLESGLPSNLLQRFLSLRALLDEHNQPALCPISPVSYGYMELSELEFLKTIYDSCKDDVKRGLGITFNPMSKYLYINLGQQAPGLFLSRLLVPVNSHERGYRSHLQVAPLGQEPVTSPKRYALTGTFRTNGLVLQVLAYDLQIMKGRDLQAAPARMDPEVGPGRWLKEIRHEFATQDDVEHTFGPYFESSDIGKDVWLASVDFGQVCTAAISVRIPPLVMDQALAVDDHATTEEENFDGSLSPPSETEDEDRMAQGSSFWTRDTQASVTNSFKEDEDFIMYESELPPVLGSDPARDIDSPSTVPRERFRNLVIKSKALYQPQFRHRRYLESSKPDEMRASEHSINPHKGIHDDKVLDFVESRIDASQTLNHHYNNTFRHRWHLWEFQKAKEAEYSVAIQAVMDMLFDAPKDKVLFVIGLDKFVSNSKLTSLHGTFGAQLIKSARVCGFAVTGINEYYTSQKCPLDDPVDLANPCEHGFIARCNTRRCYCAKCCMFFHRDVMACQNMIRAAQGHLTQQQRPLYLQPMDDNGDPVWLQDNEARHQ